MSTSEPSTGTMRGMLASGTRLGEFEIERLIGQGGMGTVYKAVDTQLGRVVAIKVLSPSLAQKPISISRFKQEAQAASRVDHNHIVKIHAFGVDGDTPYIAMEYLRGETLGVEIARGAMTFGRTADVALAVCSAVAAAHRAGVVHRDLKPSNIFLHRSDLGEVPKVLDFGISKLGEHEPGAGHTETGDILGTQQYLSPEQAAGTRDVDARSDQFAIGVILYECVTGRTPHQGGTLYALLRNIVEGRFEPPSRARLNLPPQFEAIIMRAMSRRREDRFEHVRQMGKALLPFASEQGKWQWSTHYTMPDAQLVVGTSAAVPIARGAGMAPLAPTIILSEVHPAVPSWQLPPTHTAGRPAGEPAALPGKAPALASPRAARTRSRAFPALVAAIVMVLAFAVYRIAAPERRAPPTPPPAAVSAPVTPAAPVTAAVAAPQMPAARPQESQAAAPVREPEVKHRTYRSKKRRAAADSEPVEVRYTPEGVPIL